MYFYLNGSISIAADVLGAIGFKLVIILSIVFFGISTVYLLIKAQNYDRNIFDKNGKLRNEAWKQFVLLTVL
ncbi:MAG TPA: hypothetical protein PK604_14400 [Acetivibrio clariflavus]|nr:hypothetical protein [Acetivibrio clariflavus]